MGHGTDIIWVDTILGAAPPAARTGDLAALMPGATLVIAKGCVTPGDGGGGIFHWREYSVAGPGVDGTDDGGTVIQPFHGDKLQATGAWHRLYSGALNVKWFGATGDGVTPDTQAITNAIAASAALLDNGVSRSDAVFLPAGDYLVTSQISLNVPGLKLFGDSYSVTNILVGYADDIDQKAVFDVQANSVEVRGITISSSLAADNAYKWSGFSFTAPHPPPTAKPGPPGAIGACVIDDCRIISPYRGIFLAYGECDWLDIRVAISDFFWIGIDLSSKPDAFSNNSRIRIISEIYGYVPPPSADLRKPGRETFGIILGGDSCSVEGGEISLCTWAIQLAGYRHTVKDVFFEQTNVWVRGNGNSGGSGSWIIGGQLAEDLRKPRIDAGADVGIIGAPNPLLPASSQPKTSNIMRLCGQEGGTVKIQTMAWDDGGSFVGS